MHKYYETLYIEIGEDIELLKELINDFLSIYFDNIDNLLTAVNNRDYYKMDRIAHKLKGSSMNFNFIKFTEAAAIIELEGKNSSFKDSLTSLSIMKNEIEEFKSASAEL